PARTARPRARQAGHRPLPAGSRPPPSRRRRGPPTREYQSRAGRDIAARAPVSVQSPPLRARIARVPGAKIAWLVTVAICVVAALLLLVNGYVGYFGVLLAVGAAAAVNLT